MNQTLKTHAAGIGAAGRYELRVVESPHLSYFRRVAADRVGIKNYSGSTEDYWKLSPWEREAHDFQLTDLVSIYRDTLGTNSEESIQVGKTLTGHNLILDQGLNNVMSTYAWCKGFQSCAVGTGTTPTFVDSGSVTATSSGTTVTASGAIFTSGMTGYLIKFDSGEERYITFVDTTHVTINTSLTIGSATLFTVYAVNQTGLDTEVKRTNTYLTGAGNCGVAWTSTTSAQTRTYDFSIEVSNQNYTELGWSDSNSAGNNLFSRALIAGGTVTVLIGQALRVVYTLTISVSNSTTTGSYAVTGWPVSPSVSVAGSYSLGNPFGNTSSPPVGTVTTGGASNVTNACLYEIGQTDWVSSGVIKLCTGTTIPTFGNDYVEGTAVNSDTAARASYSSGTFQRDYTFHFNVSSGNRTDFRGVELKTSTTVFVFVFDQDQKKDNLHTLDINVTIKIGRVLTNP